MKRDILSILLKSFIVLAAISFAACQDDKGDTFIKKAGDPIVFGASVRETGKIRMRGNDADAGNGLDSTYITYDPFNMDFFIQLCCEDKTLIGTYVVPSGYDGRLESKKGDDNQPLEWQDLRLPHTFYAWNIPWNEEADKYKENTEYDPTTTKIKNGLNITFYNSSEENGYEEYNNNAIYENFIGAKSAEPYSYKDHGKYVDLTFHHLVSKIKIGSFILIESNGAIQENLQADVTFVGMPTKATFYPHPNDGGRPRVDYDPDDVSFDNGVTYYIDNDATTEDVFYICPEVDFSKIDFKVEIKDIKYANYKTYYGTFNDVVFEREPGYAYDKGPEDDSKILHAGEMMTLNIVLIPGVGPGLKIIISDWSTDDPKESQYHTYPGIYSDAEVKELIDLFVNQKTYDLDEIKETLDRLFEMYGSVDAAGNKVFKLFENVNFDSNILPIFKGYILDGMGHTITLKSNYGHNSDFDYSTYFNVGPVRNVYLTDGTNTIYIDSDGYVWIADPDTPGNYIKTNNHLTELTGNEKSYDISCSTGQVHKSTYFNNNIVGS